MCIEVSNSSRMAMTACSSAQGLLAGAVTIAEATLLIILCQVTRNVV